MEEVIGRDPSGQALAKATPANAVDGPSGFDPSRVRLTGVRDDIRGVAERFRSLHGKDLERQCPWKVGWTKHQIYDALLALDAETATAADVAKIIGNASWIGESCDFCNARRDTYFEIGDEPDYEARYLYVCLLCAEHVGAIATEARRAETPKIGSVHEGAGLKDIAQKETP